MGATLSLLCSIPLLLYGCVGATGQVQQDRAAGQLLMVMGGLLLAHGVRALLRHRRPVTTVDHVRRPVDPGFAETVPELPTAPAALQRR